MTLKHRASLFLAFVALTVGGARLDGADWPEFLGPTRNGVSTESGILERFPTNGPPIVWQKTIGAGYSAPSILNGKLIVHHRMGDKEVVEAFAAKDGKSLWQYPYPSSFQDPYGYNNGPRATPLLYSNRCYTFGAEGKLLCLDLSNGRKLWERDTAKDWEIPEAFFGVGSSPVLSSNMLVVMIGGQTNAGMVGLDATTGRTVWENVGFSNWQGKPMKAWPGERNVEWRRHEKQASYATPVLATVHGKEKAFCLMRQGLVVLDPQTGKIDDSFWFRARVDDSVNAANPIVVGETIFISGAYSRVGSVLLRLSPNMKLEELWRSDVLEIHWTTPIYRDGFLYAFSGRNEPDASFRCVEMKTGKLLWERDEHWGRGTKTPPVYGRGSAIMADNKLIVLGEGGLLGLFRTTPNKPEELSRWQVPGLQYPCWAAPIIADKLVYLRSENRLVCLDFSSR